VETNSTGGQGSCRAVAPGGGGGDDDDDAHHHHHPMNCLRSPVTSCISDTNVSQHAVLIYLSLLYRTWVAK
jgi:hypothetical protein